MIFSVSIDLDPLWCYRAIWGLGETEPGGADPVTAVGTTRFCELMDEIGMRGTVFAVGRALDDPAAAAALADARARGHEIANHTWGHRYDLSKQDTATITEEIARGADAIERATGARPRGFRAPGYLLGPRMLGAAAACGAAYDASMLPSPLYQGAKAAAVAWLKVRGRGSGAVLGDPREAMGPRHPYRPDAELPWSPGSAPLVELPISSLAGLPLTGGTLHLFGTLRAVWLASLAGRADYLQLELHGVDLMDITADRLDPALSVQRDLTIPRERKMETIVRFCRKILETRESRTLIQLVQEYF